MKNSMKITLITLAIILLAVNVNTCNSSTKDKTEGTRMSIAIILGSTRKGRSSDKIGKEIKSIFDKRTDVNVEILDLMDFNLPFFNDETPPASRTIITDPATQKWSDVISKKDAFIIVSPEYNSGYPGVLKNALDSLYKEWNNKPVAFVVYSGGASGGTSVLAQLRQVAKGLEMLPVDADIKIPTSWKAFNAKGKLTHERFEEQLDLMMEQLKKARVSVDEPVN